MTLPAEAMPMKRNENLGRSPVSGGHRPMSRREFVEATAIGGAGLAMLGTSERARAEASQGRSVEEVSNDKSTGGNAMTDNSMADEMVKAKIRRALLSGPDSITREATVAEMDAQGKMTVLRPGANQ